MAKPAPNTPEWRLWLAAIEVAASPPLSPRRPTTSVAVPRITALRNALDELGVDWRGVKQARGGDPWLES